MVKKILVILLGAADAALLVVILVAAITGWRMKGQDRVPVVEPVAQESGEPSAASSLSSAIEGKEVMPMADKDSVSKKYLQDKNGSQTCSTSICMMENR